MQHHALYTPIIEFSSRCSYLLPDRRLSSRDHNGVGLESILTWMPTYYDKDILPVLRGQNLGIDLFKNALNASQQARGKVGKVNVKSGIIDRFMMDFWRLAQP